ncbi:WAS/WASL-interacting protein family member 3-like [Glycine max]|uniref:WAS/WASL-interacting protein family member 3-like n=1 Tax=Glycine max TaxID=3847 RepID=UPI00023C0F99|nr:WAS/WASL-interacting protein family member 3-like [Glycine max]|eukprot:XP_014629735.1 WAS/WASL-interacting protein family member 3-like [Glycine max]
MADAEQSSECFDRLEVAIADLTVAQLHSIVTLDSIVSKLDAILLKRNIPIPSHHADEEVPSDAAEDLVLLGMPKLLSLTHTPIPPLSLPSPLKPTPSPTLTAAMSMPTPSPRPTFMPQHPAPLPAPLTSIRDTTGKLVARLHPTLPLESGNNIHLLSLGSSLASLSRPPYSSSSPPPPPPEPPPPPRPRLARVYASRTVMFGHQGLGHANRYSQLSLPLVASSFDHATTISL